MAFPPVPESPHRQLPSKSSGTPRVGMHLYQNDDDDDDVSVLTFHTMGTRDATTHMHPVGSGSGSSFVKSARESLERLISESKNSEDDDGKSLSRISEEGGSQVSSSCHSKRGCDLSNASAKSNEKEMIDDDEYDDDDTISLAESILDSANKVLSSIGSSPYYAGRSKKSSSPAHESPLPQPNSNHPLPMKEPVKSNDEDDDEIFPKNIYKTKKELSSPKKTISDRDDQLEATSNFLSSYFQDENTKPATKNSYRGDHISSITTRYQKGSDEHLQKLESETKHLQLLLKERQLETKKASQSLGSSIKKANALLEKISAV